jgi:uncharacterized protein YndB with AHSA1/START domain
MPKNIEQTVTFDASPHAIYEALTDSKKHAAFTGDSAEIGREVGTKFTAHGGMLSGVNVDLVRDKLVVQAWRAGNFPEGVYTIASFKLEPQGATKTKLTFTQYGVPDEAFEMISQGWNQKYWEPLKKYLAQ